MRRVCDAAFPVQYQQHVQALTAHHRQLAEWAENCPENFENRALLVGAEIARHRRPGVGCRAPLRRGDQVSARERLRPQRSARQRAGGSLLRGTRLRDHLAAICEMLVTAISAGAQMGRSGNSISLLPAPGGPEEAAAAASTGTIGAPRRTSGPCDRDQGVASRVGRDGPRKAARCRDAYRDASCRRGTRRCLRCFRATAEQRIVAEAHTYQPPTAVIVQPARRSRRPLPMLPGNMILLRVLTQVRA